MAFAGNQNRLVWDGKKKGHYEVYFLMVNDPEKRIGLWIRYTLVVPTRGQPQIRIWGFFFDRHRPEKNFALTNDFLLSQLENQSQPFSFALEDSFLTNRSARGEIKDSSHSLAWKLEWEDSPFHLQHLPYPWMYERSFPKTKVHSPHPHIKISGEITINGETLKVEEAPGMQSHLWGRELAPHWVWGHCNSFREEEAYFEGLSVQLSVGPLRLPPLTIFFLYFRNQLYTLNSISSMLKNRSRSYIGLWRFWGKGGKIEIEGEATTLVQWLMGVEYHGPQGERRFCHNTRVGDLRLRVVKDGKLLANLTARGTCAIEWVRETPDERVRFYD